MPATPTLDELATRAATLASRHSQRTILGITGPPGAGKSTLGQRLAAAVAALGVPVARVPMDGFHLADAELTRLGRSDRKGAIDTFDVDGYAATLERARTISDRVVYAPDYDRTIDQPVAGSIAVPPEARLVITEGNYLLAADPAWTRMRALLDEVWFCALPDDERVRRLVARHERHGKAAGAARVWVESVDEPNAVQVMASAAAADLVVDMRALDLLPGRD